MKFALLILLVVTCVVCDKIVPMVYNFSGLYEPHKNEERFYGLGNLRGNSIIRISVSGMCSETTKNKKCDELCVIVPDRVSPCPDDDTICMWPTLLNSEIRGDGIFSSYKFQVGSCFKCDGKYQYQTLMADIDLGTWPSFNVSIGSCDVGASLNYNINVKIQYAVQF